LFHTLWVHTQEVDWVGKNIFQILLYSDVIDKQYLYCDERTRTYYCDQENPDSINNMWKNLKDVEFDIILDDGPHTYSSNIIFYKKYINKLKTKGIYIIEYIHLDFIDKLCNEIIDNNINCNVVKLIIPYPQQFTHISNDILKMNNLLIIQNYNNNNNYI